MSQSPQSILRVGGTLYSGASALGLYHSVACRVITRSKAILAEEWGQQEVGRLWCGETWVLAAALRNYDPTAIGKVFPNASGSTASWNVSSGTRAGTLLTPSPISFVPRVTGHPTISFPAAVALPDASAKFTLSLKAELSFGIVFMAQVDDNGAVQTMGP